MLRGMPTARLSLLACALAALAAAPLRAEPAVIGLARSYLGPDSTLDGIRSVHFVGTLERVDPDQPSANPVRGDLDLVFSKPLRQRLVIHTLKTTITTVLDGYDAWDFLENNLDSTKFQLRLLSVAEIKSLRANTWESLNFYRGLGSAGSVEDKGSATVDAVTCERVDFDHGDGLVYERFFDRDTGRLVLTVKGRETIRESGEIRADGLRFPRVIVSTTKTASGKDLVSTVTFTRITLNEAVDPSAFAVPDILRKRQRAEQANAH